MTARARLPATVIALGVTSFFTDVASEMVFPLLPAFLATLGAGPTFLGLLEGVADAVAAAIKYRAGAWSDGRSRKGFVLVGYGLAHAVRPLLALAGAAWHVLALRVVDRIGKGLRSAPRDALISAAVPPEQAGRAFGFHRAMDHAGAVVGPLLATGLLAAGLEVRTVFALTIVPGLVAVASVLLVKEPSLPPAAASSVATPRVPLPGRLRQLLAIVGLFALANASDAFLLVRASEVGVPTAWIPTVWLVLHVSKMAWSARAGEWSDRHPPARLIGLGWLLYVACYLVLAATTAPWLAIVTIALYGAVAGLTEPAEKKLIRLLAPADAQGRAFGAYHGVVGAAAIPAGLLTGLLWERLGAPVALGTSAALALVAAALLWSWERRAPSGTTGI